MDYNKLVDKLRVELGCSSVSFKASYATALEKRHIRVCNTYLEELMDNIPEFAYETLDDTAKGSCHANLYPDMVEAKSQLPPEQRSR